MILDLILGWDLEMHPKLCHCLLKALQHKLPQRHRGVDLGADDDKLTRNLLRRLGNSRICQLLCQFSLLGYSGDHRQLVRFTCSVVADNQEALVVCRLQELKLLKDHALQLLAHAIRDHKGLHQPQGLFIAFSFVELNNRFNRIKLNQV